MLKSLRHCIVSSFIQMKRQYYAENLLDSK